MTYRQAPDSAPLVFTVRERVLALDADNGSLRWEQPFPGGAGRLFLVGRTLVVTGRSNGNARCFDLESGEPRGHFALGFRVDTGLVRGDRLFLAGHEAIACITASGALAWGAWMEVESTSLMHEVRALVFRSPSGDELWRMSAAELGGMVADPGLLLGDLVAQPDFAG